MNPSEAALVKGHFFCIKGGNKFYIDELSGETGAVSVVLLSTRCERRFHTACMSARACVISGTKALDARIEWSDYVVRIRGSDDSTARSRQWIDSSEC